MSINDLIHSGTWLRGWFVTSFLGVKTGDLEDIPSGVNAVPLTLTDGDKEEEAALVAGVTGYRITGPTSSVSYPSVQTVHGWGLLMDPNSVYN